MSTDASVRETARLISSEKVEGTSVRRSNGDNIGTIEHVMLDKRSGRITYAAMSFGGVLGIGSEYRALPWSALRYNERLDAYELNVTDDQLKNAPLVATDFFEAGVADRRWEDAIHRHYKRRRAGKPGSLGRRSTGPPPVVLPTVGRVKAIGPKGRFDALDVAVIAAPAHPRRNRRPMHMSAPRTPGTLSRRQRDGHGAAPRHGGAPLWCFGTSKQTAQLAFGRFKNSPPRR